MSFSTFSGPLRAGTVKEGAGRNTGVVMLNQSYDTGDLTGSTVGNIDGARFVLPRGSQIVNIIVDQVVVATAGTTTVSVGTTSGGTELYAATVTTAGGRFTPAPSAANLLAYQTSTTADTTVYVRIAVATATLTAGRAIVTIVYAQRADNGAQFPAQG
jgi:hypothetical protein